MFADFLKEYFSIILFLFISGALSAGFILINYIFSHIQVAGVTGLEPATSCVTGRRSNQLRYTPTIFNGGR